MREGVSDFRGCVPVISDEELDSAVCQQEQHEDPEDALRRSKTQCRDGRAHDQQRQHDDPAPGERREKDVGDGDGPGRHPVDLEVVLALGPHAVQVESEGVGPEGGAAVPQQVATVGGNTRTVYPRPHVVQPWVELRTVHHPVDLPLLSRGDVPGLQSGPALHRRVARKVVEFPPLLVDLRFGEHTREDDVQDRDPVAL